MFIDAIDPRGTVNPRNYKTAGNVYAELEKYENYGGGNFLWDAAIYFSYRSNFDPQRKPERVPGYTDYFQRRNEKEDETHTNLAIKFGKIMAKNHIPYGVITKKDLNRLSEFQVVILSNVAVLDEEELRELKKYVAGGGHLIATKSTSIISENGEKQSNFLLADLLGVDYAGKTSGNVTYVSPRENAEKYFEGFDKIWPPTLESSQMLVRAKSGTEILATITLPYTYEWEWRYASLLTNPPGNYTDWPSVVKNHFGKGSSLYFAGAVEKWSNERLDKVIGNLVRSVCDRPMYHHADAPSCVEITMFDQPEANRFVLHAVNYQYEMPNIPVYHVPIQVNTHGKEVKKATIIADDVKELDIKKLENGCIEITIPSIETYSLITLAY